MEREQTISLPPRLDISTCNNWMRSPVDPVSRAGRVDIVLNFPDTASSTVHRGGGEHDTWKLFLVFEVRTCRPVLVLWGWFMLPTQPASISCRTRVSNILGSMPFGNSNPRTFVTRLCPPYRKWRSSDVTRRIRFAYLKEETVRS